MDAAVAAALADTVGMTQEAIRAANGDLGWWGTYVKTVEDGLFALHDLYTAQGLPNAYGLAIFTLVFGVKGLTLPLNWQTFESAASNKAMKPQMDLARKWWSDNSDLLNREVGQLYMENEVNPLAGCLPSLIQIPVVLGVYYAVTSIAKAQIFGDENFLWLPSLSGPIADRTEGIRWLTEGWVNGAPPLGWHDTLCYLSLPAILVCSQFTALKLLGSFDALDDSETSQNAALVLKFLPFMLGWFALNAPAGLGVYWVANNVLTTASTLGVKKLVAQDDFSRAVDVAALGPRRTGPQQGGDLDWAKPESAAAPVPEN
jgi:YidC/Oxa1 family membrane protein insertase